MEKLASDPSEQKEGIYLLPRKTGYSNCRRQAFVRSSDGEKSDTESHSEKVTVHMNDHLPLGWSGQPGVQGEREACWKELQKYLEEKDSGEGVVPCLLLPPETDLFCSLLYTDHLHCIRQKGLKEELP